MLRTLFKSPRRTLLGAALLPFLATGCDFQPYAPTDMEFKLSENPMRNSVEALAVLDEDWGAGAADAAGAQILGSLEGLFGTPQAPRYALTEYMVDDLEIDPNFAGDYELSDASWDAVTEENRTRRFKLQIELVEDGRYSEVSIPGHAMDLAARWEAEYLPQLEEDPQAIFDDEEGLTWHDAAVELFEFHYPSLRESAELYRLQCLHCHGVSGGGDGPTSPFLDPPPRDYRQGVFKWVSVDRNKVPRRDDLMRILREGVTFTAMPNFERFSRGELEGLVDYVRLLSMRGQSEWLMVLETVDSDGGTLPPDVVTETYNGLWDSWIDAEGGYVFFDGEVPHPDEMTPERIAHGRDLFRGNVANCYTCHGVFGRGDGDSKFEYVAVTDEDGNPMEEEVPISFTTLDVLTDYDYIVVLDEPGAVGAPLSMAVPAGDKVIDKVLDETELKALLAGDQVSIGSGYKIDLELGWRVNLLTDAGLPVTRKQAMMESVVRPDEWGNESKPRNIQQGIFRGGGRPIDLYRRVKYGISGTIMPAADASLSDDDLWDIVYYVYQLAEKPYAKRRVVTAQQSSMAEGSAQ